MAAGLLETIQAARSAMRERTSSVKRLVAAEPQGLDLAVELAHDVRSPLGALLTLAELMQSGACGPVTDAQVRHLQSIQNAARGLARLTEDVVESGRPGALDVRRPAAPFSVDELLRSVREIVQPMADASGLDLVVHNSAPPQWMGRRCALERVLVNLVTNALKYTEQGRVEFGARIIAVNRVEFFVRDTGTGLPMRAPGRGASGVDRWRTSSAGLGLGICRRLLNGMGATLEVASRPDEGTRFHFVVALPEQS